MNSKRFSELPDRQEAFNLLHTIARGHSTYLPRKVDKPLILYGAGELGKMAQQYFDRLSIPVQCVVDRKPEIYAEDKFWRSHVVSPEDIPEHTRKSSLLVVCVATSPYSEILNDLKNQGWEDVVSFYDVTEAYLGQIPINNGWKIMDLRSYIAKIEHILTRWQDDISHAHYLQFIAWRALREEWIFEAAPVITDNRYFIPEVLAVLHDHEVFLDVGAHYGEVISRFVKEVKGKYGVIYALEPDKENFRALCVNLKEELLENGENIELGMKALGSVAGKAMFYSGLGYASKISASGKETVDVMRLDDLCISATFIKIHVEGAEFDVIRGGMETITRQRPVLVVTLYHNREGLSLLPRQIMTMLDNYAYYFRLHAWQGQGSVIYAIPMERQA
jgi:FkbM family methyltransferase